MDDEGRNMKDFLAVLDEYFDEQIGDLEFVSGDAIQSKDDDEAMAEVFSVLRDKVHDNQDLATKLYEVYKANR